MREPKYSIGDKVYHVTCESPEGVVIDISFLYSTGKHQYYVAFAFNETLICMEHELSTEKRII